MDLFLRQEKGGGTMKCNRRATDIIAQFILEKRNDPEYQEGYQKWLREQEVKK